MSADLYAAFMAEQEKTSDARDATTPASTTTFAPSAEVIQPRTSTPADRTGTPSALKQKEDSPLWKRNTHGNDILFDAEEAELEDDFGEFETVDDANHEQIIAERDAFSTGGISTRAPAASRTGSLIPNLLDSDDAIPHHPVSSSKLPFRTKTADTQRIVLGSKLSTGTSWEGDWGAFQQTPATKKNDSVTIGKPTNPGARIGTETKSDAPDDDWEPFEDGEAPPHQGPVTSNVLSASEKKPQQVKSPIGATPNFERPTNVPPPSSLLQLLSSVFETIHDKNLTHAMPKTALASRILLVFRTASRLVAGRTLRWKRDAILAQSMRIGQAGKSGGMKLASVNKSESTREERDAEEMIRDWTNYVHEFNSILSQAEFPPHRMKISASPSLKILKHTGLSDASKQCALCGLKRSERLIDVDVDIDDLFGEFWTEHWGHNDCCEFWYSYKDLLAQR